jgi:hypothetical protein
MPRCGYANTSTRVALWWRRHSPALNVAFFLILMKSSHSLLSSLTSKIFNPPVTEDSICTLGAMDSLSMSQDTWAAIFFQETCPVTNSLALDIAESHTEGTQPYVYNAFETAEQARFLRYRVDDESDKVLFDFVSGRLYDFRDRYIAVSYCWGTKKPDRCVVLTDTSYITVTENVETLMRHLISTSKEGLIWIDAICINQQDNAEKSSQIQLMKDVYAGARKVEVWLGLNISSIHETAMWSLINQMQSPLDTGRVWNSSDPKDETSIRADEDHDCDTADDDADAPPDGILFAFSVLALSEWFERIWVVQEVCFGRQVDFHYGKIVFPLESLCSILLELKKHYPWFPIPIDNYERRSDGLKYVSPAVEQLNWTYALRDGIQSSEWRHWNTLGAVFASLHSLKATEPRDKIFALLGLASEESYRGLIPDYGATVPDVFTDVTRHLISNNADNRGLSILGFAGISFHRPAFQDHYVASWIPDFSNTSGASIWSSKITHYKAASLYQTAVTPFKLTNEVSLGPEGSEHHPPRDRARNNAPTWQADIPEQLRSTSELDALLVFGSCIDEITGIGLQGRLKDQPDYYGPDNFSEWVEDALQIAHRLEPYRTNENPEEVCWRVLFANVVSQKTPESSLFENIDALRSDIEDPDSWLDVSLSLQYSSAGVSRRVFWTKEGYMGLAANAIQPADQVWLFAGASVPFIVRPIARIQLPSEIRVRQSEWSSPSLSQLVCEAYVHGIMQGEEAHRVEEDTETLVLI